MHSKKSKIAKILLSVTALFLISVVAFGITYSWIEGGTTLSIRTKEKGDVVTSEVPKVGGTITLDPESQKVISLIDYDETARYYKTLGGDFENVYFSPASSINGKDFYFPVGKNSQDNTIFRKGTTNDIGTKFISFEFDVKAADKCYLAFAEEPVIKITKGNSTVTFDKSAFRFYISFNDSKFFKFSTSKNARQYIIDENGTIGTDTNFNLFNSYKADNSLDYTYIDREDTTNRKLHTLEKNGTAKIKVVIWLDYFDSLLPANSNIFGGEVDIDFRLKVGQEKIKANFEVVNFESDGETLSTEVGGIVNPESGWFPIDKEVTSTASVTNTKFNFAGWFTDPECTIPAKDANGNDHDANDFTLKTIPENVKAGGEVTYYAKFVQKENMIYFIPSSSWKADDAWFAAYIWTGSSNNWITLTDEDGDGVYSGIVPDDKNYTEVLFTRQNPDSSTASWGNTWTQTDDQKLPTGDATLFVLDSGWAKTGKWKVPFTVTAVPTGNGSATVNGADLSAISYKDADVEIKAEPNEGYSFAGWYTDSNCTTPLNSSHTTATQTVKPQSATTYFAKFEKIPVLTVNALATPAGFGTATVNGSISDSVQTNSTVELVATPAEGYRFVGWYKDADFSENIGSTYNKESTTYKVTGTDGEVVNIYAQFEKIPVVTVKTSVIPANCGTAKVNKADYVTGIEIGTSVTLSATDSVSGYSFEGWYTKSDLSEKIGTNYGSKTATYEITDASDGDTVTIYANFVKSFTAKAHAVTTGTNNSSTGGTVVVTGKSAGANVENTYKANAKVVFTAQKASGYSFVGWFDAATGGNQVHNETTYTVDNITTNIELYARFERVIYLKPNSNWTSGDAWFAAYVWTGSSTKWYKLTDDDNDGIYSAIIDTKYTDIIFVRMNKDKTALSWDSKWDQSGDLTIPKISSGKTLYTIPSGVWNSFTDDKWSVK